MNDTTTPHTIAVPKADIRPQPAPSASPGLGLVQPIAKLAASRGAEAHDQARPRTTAGRSATGAIETSDDDAGDSRMKKHRAWPDAALAAVQERPVTAVFAAALVGAMVGKWWSDREAD